MGSKCKDIATGDGEGQCPSKKTRGKQLGKYSGGTAMKMEGVYPCEKYVSAG